MKRGAFSLVCRMLALGLMLSLAGAVLTYPGKLDPAFDGDGFVFTNLSNSTTRLNAVGIDANGMILAVGSARIGYGTDMLLARYQPDGHLDSSFQAQGYVLADFGSGSDAAWDLALQADEKIVAAGSGLMGDEGDQ